MEEIQREELSSTNFNNIMPTLVLRPIKNKNSLNNGDFSTYGQLENFPISLLWLPKTIPLRRGPHLLCTIYTLGDNWAGVMKSSIVPPPITKPCRQTGRKALNTILLR